MEFNEKLQELRKQQGLTQEELAQMLYVSRTAISKWESGRGFPNIDSLKRIAKLFSVTIDELLSKTDLIGIAEAETKRKENYLGDVIFGLLDAAALLIMFLPLFAQRTKDAILHISLLSLQTATPWVRMIYFGVLGLTSAFGVLTLVLQNCLNPFWLKWKRVISFALNMFAALIFISSLQVYPAIVLLLFIVIKFFVFVNKQ